MVNGPENESSPEEFLVGTVRFTVEVADPPEETEKYLTVGVKVPSTSTAESGLSST